ncbi:uncharacterized protein I303_102061 [Kwoniella dejecticola CBS 10117]|uniref:KH domain-containing protein n=1 Tax=Kwoniella dejecticola CBS 10117 TaxID=1296121 RepID=A0A1A6AC03_9TREE|nr:KH domain-containing protein [Kwoniella dejecticola CBS 10117]OBR87592.1 KH domain-containing protein [Kwoniella dejecticola CBS 10117]
MAEDRKSRWDDPSSSTPPTSASASADASDAAARAAAIAAKIAASLRPGAQGNELVKQEKKDEGDFVKDIEVNDLRNRYVLTKGSTQKQIEEETGASVVTKGVWVPDRSKMPPGEAPLYLHIVATSQSILDAAVAKVQELIDQELGPLLDQRTIIARNRALGLPPPEQTTLPGGRQKWPEEKLYISLESLRNFNVRAKTVGPGGMFVKYIQAETGARVQIKGQGSGFMENDTGRESDDPMHINIAAPTQDQIDRAKVLCNDLLEVLRQEWSKARDAMAAQQQHHNQGGVYQQGYGTYAPQGQQGGQDAYAAYYAQQNGQNGTPLSAPSATPAAGGAAAAGGATPAEGTDAWAQYAAYWAAYGYDVNDPQFQAWQASQYGQQGQAPQAGAATPAP